MGEVLGNEIVQKWDIELSLKIVVAARLKDDPEHLSDVDRSSQSRTPSRGIREFHPRTFMREMRYYLLARRLDLYDMEIIVPFNHTTDCQWQ